MHDEKPGMEETTLLFINIIMYYDLLNRQAISGVGWGGGGRERENVTLFCLGYTAVS